MDDADLVLTMLQQDREPDLPDEGFSRSVLRALPPHPAAVARGRWVSGAALLAGVAATVKWAPLPGEPWASSGLGHPASMTLLVGCAIAVLACTVWAYVATDFLELRHD